jgi:hypothetical protein
MTVIISLATTSKTVRSGVLIGQATTRQFFHFKNFKLETRYQLLDNALLVKHLYSATKGVIE